MNRQTKTLLPTTRELSKPRSVVPDMEVTALRKHQEKQAQHYNKSAKELEPLATGDVVRMKPFVAGKKTWEKAMVKERLDERSYTVETANGDTYHRNRFHVRKTKESMDNTSAPVEQPQGFNEPQRMQSSKQKHLVQFLTVYNTRPCLITLRPARDV